MFNAKDLFERLKSDDLADEQIRTLLAEGKRDRAMLSVMEFAVQWDMYLDQAEAAEVIDLYTEDERSADEITADHFPDEHLDLGMERSDTIVDPEHRNAPMPSELNQHAKVNSRD
jgi:hypothetical protein